MTDRNEGTLAAAADLDRRVELLPKGIAPPIDLWPRIAAGIHAETAALDVLAGRLRENRVPPRDLWPAIRARLAPVTSRRRRRAALPSWWVMTGAGLAAALALGVFIGRQSMDRGGGEPGTAAVAENVPRERPLSTPYRRAVGEHLRDAETVLVLFNSSEESDPDLVGLARELAATSRLLMESRAGDDPQVRAMLLDLELLLMQVARVVDTDPTENQVAREGTADAAVLARLRLMIAVEADRAGI